MKKTTRILAFTLLTLFLISLIVPVASARGSIYISNYSAGMTAGSNGNVTISYHITGMGTMDEIGSTVIVIFENGVQIKTYLHTNTSGMMGYNKAIHGGTITYAGTIGKTYNAGVVYMAGKNGGWDSRTLVSNTVTAKR
ncbi:MAG: hypothetical protein LBD23_07885 [Oscillospiraceae bacterium]|jgi:hypothetical protein|nr:hypothetical protein [Oscillospiraceae bacterium]